MEILEEATAGIKIRSQDINTLRDELNTHQVQKYTLGVTSKRKDPLQKLATTLTETTKGGYIISTTIVPSPRFKHIGLEGILDIREFNEEYSSQLNKAKKNISIGDGQDRYNLTQFANDFELTSKTEISIESVETLAEGLRSHSNVLTTVVNNIYKNSEKGIQNFSFIWKPMGLKQNIEKTTQRQRIKQNKKDKDSPANKVLFETPTDISLEDVIGNEIAKDALMDLETSEELFQQLGFKPNEYSGNALLIGPPGNGKTMLARAYAATTGRPFYAVKFTDFASSFFASTELKLKEIFRHAKEHNGVMFFDEIDAITQNRESNSNDYMSGILNVLQTEIDGIEKDNKITVLAATNCPSKIDGSLLRPGRFDKLINVRYPTLQNIEQLLTKLSKNAEDISGTKLFAENLDYNTVAKDMRKYAFVDVEEIFNRTRMNKIRTLKKGGILTQISPMDFTREINAYERRSEIGRRPSSDFDYKL
jgi:SpoVK/Ycf46/Vps4 family AAA+-type ATPase